MPSHTDVTIHAATNSPVLQPARINVLSAFGSPTVSAGTSPTTSPTRINVLSTFPTPAAGAGSAYPDATNTGYANAPGYPGSLTPFTGTIQSNTTYSYRSFFDGLFCGSVGTPLVNVTFYGCRFYASAPGGVLCAIFGDNFTFDYCSFEPNLSAPPTSYAQSYQYGIEADGSWSSFVQQLTVTHCDLWGFGNAIDITGSTQAKPHRFEHNWIHDAAADGGSYHTDGIGSLSGSGVGSYLVMNHNTIESLGNTNGVAFQQGVYDHYTITNNWFGGFGYCVAVWNTNNNITFTDNVFSTRLQCVFGPLYDSTMATSTGSLWRRNIWRVPSGAYWGNPAHDGWYWMPVASASPSNDTPFVSLTDFTG